ncbi:MAG: WD40 repeat domain-containing protein [Promethearchaeota archaeon]
MLSILKIFNGNNWWVLSVAISPDSNYVISGSFDGKIIIWDLKTGEIIRTLAEHRREVNSISISPDCKYIASGSNDKTIKILNLLEAEIKNLMYY